MLRYPSAGFTQPGPSTVYCAHVDRMENSLQCLTLIFMYIFSDVPRVLMGFWNHLATARGVGQGITLHREDRRSNEPLRIEPLEQFSHVASDTLLWPILMSWNKTFFICMVLKSSCKMPGVAIIKHFSLLACIKVGYVYSVSAHCHILDLITAAVIVTL